MPTVSNWLTIRGAGVLFPLQATPLTATLNLVQAKKPSGSQIFSNTRQLYPGWPEKSVYKITMPSQGVTSAVVNDLYLETTSKLYKQLDQVVPGVSPLIDAGGDAIMSGMFCSCDWTGGDDKVYQSGTVVLNTHGLDANGDDIWTILSRSYTRDAYGFWTESSSNITYNNTAPDTTGAPCVLNGGLGVGVLSDPMNSAYASYTTELSAVDFMDDYIRQAGDDLTSLAVRFNPRHPDDSAHGTSSYVTGYDTVSVNGDVILVNGADLNTRFNGIFTYEPKSTDSGANTNQRSRTTCKWKYNSSACDDCWYAGKTVNIDVKYKKLGITKVVTPAPDTSSNVSVEFESSGWSDHSIVSYSLTLPSGTGTNQIGDTFDVPVSAGYIVAIDDIKLVSVS